jgi:transcriptional regulator with XRE-family HTH domain
MNSIQMAVTELSRKGWTYRAMSEALGVSRYTMARWANGVTEPVPVIPILFSLNAMALMGVTAWPRVVIDPPIPLLV